MARLEIRKPFRTIPKSAQDFEKFFRDTVGVQQESIENPDLASDSVTTTKVANKAITLQKLADLTADRIIGRIGSDGEAQQLTAQNVRDLLQAIAWVFAETVQFANTVQFDQAAQFNGDIGFHGETPTGQQPDPGAPTIATVSGSGADTDINDNFAALESTVNDLRTILNTKGITA